MSSFEFATANRIVFGVRKLNELSKQIAEHTKHVLLVHGHSSDAIPRVKETLSTLGTPFTEFSVHGEPTVAVIREGITVAQDCDLDALTQLIEPFVSIKANPMT